MQGSTKMINCDGWTAKKLMHWTSLAELNTQDYKWNDVTDTSLTFYHKNKIDLPNQILIHNITAVHFLSLRDQRKISVARPVLHRLNSLPNIFLISIKVLPNRFVNLTLKSSINLIKDYDGNWREIIQEYDGYWLFKKYNQWNCCDQRGCWAELCPSTARMLVLLFWLVIIIGKFNPTTTQFFIGKNVLWSL